MTRKQQIERWFYEESEGEEFVAHLNGVAWNEAPRPFFWHRHKAQTKALLDGELVERCACLATRYPPGRWFKYADRERSFYELD